MAAPGAPLAGDAREHVEVRVPHGEARGAPLQEPVAERRERHEQQPGEERRRLEAHRVTFVHSAWSWRSTRSACGTDAATVATAVTVRPADARRTRTASRSDVAGLRVGPERERVIRAEQPRPRGAASDDAHGRTRDEPRVTTLRSIGFAGERRRLA